MKNKRRERRGEEALFGVNPIAEALLAGKRKIFRILIKKGIKKSGATSEHHTRGAKRKGIQVENVDIAAVAKLAGAEGHQGIAAVVSPVAIIQFRQAPCLRGENARIQSSPVLDGVTDPRNLGAIIRSAEAFRRGSRNLSFAKGAAGYTPVAAKASAGAGEYIKLCPVV